MIGICVKHGKQSIHKMTRGHLPQAMSERDFVKTTPTYMLEMYVRPLIKYVCFCFFCVLLTFSLFSLFNAGVFCFSPFFIMKARWVTIWLRLVFCAICFSYVNKHTYLVFASSNFGLILLYLFTALLPKVID